MAKHLPPRKRININAENIKLPEIKLPTVGKLAEATDTVWRGIQTRRTSDAVFSFNAIWPLLVAIAIYAAGLYTHPEGLTRLALFLAPCLIASVPAAFRILVAALRKNLRERDTLIVIAVIGAFCLGEYEAGALAAIFYRLGELLEGLAVYTGKDTLSKLKDRLPEKADVEEENGVSRVAPQQIAVGDMLSVMPDELIPVDGEVVEGISSVDTSFLTGSAAPLGVSAGMTVLSGCVNLGSSIRIRALRTADESAAAKLMETLEMASANRSEREKSVSRFTGATSLAVFILGLIVGILPPIFDGEWSEHLRRGLGLAVLALPTGMLVSMPLTYLGGILRCAYRGIFIKGTRFIESLAKTQTMVFEKTGTVTERRCVITEVFPRSVSEQELLNMAALAESHSEHPIAEALRTVCGREAEEEIIEVEEVECRGVSAFAAGKHVCVGNASFLNEHGVECDQPRRKGIPVHVAVDNVYWGYFLVNNPVKDNAFDSMEAIRHNGVKSTIMLTGDLHSVARPVASSLNFDMVKTELNKDGKLTAVEYLMAAKPERTTLAFVGDGDRDGELFKRVDAGVVLGALHTSRAIEDADVVIMDDDLSILADTLSIARRTEAMARLNVMVTLVLRGAGILLCLLGILPLMAVVLIEAGAMIFTLVNTLRVYVGIQIRRRKEKK